MVGGGVDVGRPTPHTITNPSELVTIKNKNVRINLRLEE